MRPGGREAPNQRLRGIENARRAPEAVEQAVISGAGPLRGELLDAFRSRETERVEALVVVAGREEHARRARRDRARSAGPSG